MKITLLGDSIRMNYTERVKELLGEDFEVYSPNDNGRFSKYTIRMIADHKPMMEGTRIVHWNNGLWDICNCLGDDFFTPIDEYVSNMTRIADELLRRYDKVIFATTTPLNKHPEFNDSVDVERYNSVIVPILEAKGIIINDLYTPMSKDIERFVRADDHIHLTDEGNEICAKKVADLILSVANELK
jgi:hypothetical protein